MSKVFLGIDTSCYTTSVALINEDGTLQWEDRKVLEVPKGERGLSQSEMIFQHTKALPILLEKAFFISKGLICAVGASAFPRRQKDSYMPAFLVGMNYGKTVAAALQVPFYSFSHQEGHVWASLLEEVFGPKETCYGIQCSGGTLEGFKIDWAKGGELKIELLLESADISLGQLIDRIGVKSNLPFPAGPHYPQVSLIDQKVESFPVLIREGKIYLAGAETSLIRRNLPTPDLLKETLVIAGMTIEKMCDLLAPKDAKILLVGGVLANYGIRDYLRSKRNHLYFAEPRLSSDNAVGIGRATLERYREQED